MSYRTLLLSVLVLLMATACDGDDARPARDFPGTIAKEVVGEDVDGIQVYVISAEDPDGVARDCVDYYREDYKAASCYVFKDQAAYESAQVSDEYGRAMKNLCWSAYWSASIAADDGADENPQFDPLVCSRGARSG